MTSLSLRSSVATILALALAACGDDGTGGAGGAGTGGGSGGDDGGGGQPGEGGSGGAAEAAICDETCATQEACGEPAGVCVSECNSILEALTAAGCDDEFIAYHECLIDSGECQQTPACAAIEDDVTACYDAFCDANPDDCMP